MADRIRFPLEWEKCFEADCDLKCMNPREFFSEFTFEPGRFVYPLSAIKARGDDIEVTFGY